MCAAAGEPGAEEQKGDRPHLRNSSHSISGIVFGRAVGLRYPVPSIVVSGHPYNPSNLAHDSGYGRQIGARVEQRVAVPKASSVNSTPVPYQDLPKTKVASRPIRDATLSALLPGTYCA